MCSSDLFPSHDRSGKPRVPIGAKLVAKLLETAGATRIMTMDLHADQIQGFFEKPVDHLFASTIFLPYVRSLNLENLTIASPDMGVSKRAYAYSKFLESDVVVCYKQRKIAVFGKMVEEAKQAKNETAKQKWQFEQDKAFSDLINELGGDGKF